MEPQEQSHEGQCLGFKHGMGSNSGNLTALALWPTSDKVGQ